MKRIFAFAVVWAFVLNAGGAASAAADATETNAPKQQQQTNRLAAQLPASELAMTLNAGRLFSDSLPQLLAGNQPTLAGIVGKIDELKNKTGFDLRQFRQVAVGISSRKNESGKTNLEAVILARGAMNANAIIALAKTAASGRYREEKIGSRSVYIFQARNAADKQNNSQSSGLPSVLLPGLGFVIDFDKLFSGEFAVAAFDDNTLAIGSAPRLRETFGTGARLGGEVLTLLDRKPNQVAALGAKITNGLSELLPYSGNDEISKNLDAIRYFAASFDANENGAVFSAMARTAETEQAKSLQAQIEGLQSLGNLLGGKTEEKKAIMRTIANVKIARAANDVTLDLQIPQSDISILLNKKK